MSKIEKKEIQEIAKEKTFYIFVIFSKTKDTDIAFKFSSNKTELFYSLKQKIDEVFRYITIFKHIHTPKNLSETVNIVFNREGEIFKVSFKIDESTFIFNPILKIKKNKISNEKNIIQRNVIKTIEKIDIFSKCLAEKKENEEFGALYRDSVDILKSNQDFELLIYLFIKMLEIDKNNKDLFKKFLDIFWDITEYDKISSLNNQNESCKQYLNRIIEIESNSEKIISENNLDKVKFYGFILFYLNTYEYEKFQLVSKNLQENKGKENFFFDILFHFSSTFSKDVNINLEEYINYLTEKDFKILEISGFSYFKKIEEFIHVLNKKKDKMIKMSGFKTLKIPKILNYNLENSEQFINELVEIISFSEKNKKLLLFLSSTFWKKMAEVLGNPSTDNISDLFQLREQFKYYLKIVKAQYENNKNHVFYINAEETNGNDEIALTLNKIIEKYIEENKDITNDEIINQIAKFNIYYIDDIYINRRELYFLDKINFDENDNEWMDNYKKANFEKIFKNDIEKYIIKIISKIKKIEDLGKVIAIINEDEIKNLDKMEFLIRELKKKIFIIMRNSYSNNKANIKNGKLSALNSLFRFIYKYIQKVEKIEDILEKLDYESRHLIFIELLKSFPDDKILKKYIFDFYINNMNIYYKNISELFDILNEEDILNFMSRISDDEDNKNYRIISYKNFFYEKESININLLQELSKKIDKIKTTAFFGKSKEVLEKIYTDIEDNKLEIKYLKSLRSYPKINFVKRLELLKILNHAFNPEDKYDELEKKYKKALKDIEDLKKISQALKEFHGDFYKEEIKKIKEACDKFNNGKIEEFSNISQLIVMLGEDMKKKVEKINKLKLISIFKKKFHNIQGANEDIRFELAFKELESEFKAGKIKASDKEIKIMIELFGLKSDEKTQKELKYIEDSNGAEKDINSMIYFCENFKLKSEEKKQENENEKKSELEDTLEEIYKGIKSKKPKKDAWNKIKDFYDLKNKGNNVEFFNLFYNQKEAIGFLLEKKDVDIIKDKLINIDNIIKVNDIDEVENCMNFFNNDLIYCKDKLELFQKIKKIDENILNNFKKYIKIFPYLEDLYNNSDNSYSLYINAKKYFSNATYYINLNYEEKYIYKDKSEEEKSVNLNTIKSIKHKINIPNDVEIRLKENKDLPEGQDKIAIEKTQLLLKFKEIVSNIELIEQFTSFFETKGCSLPIEIEIRIKYPEVTYFLKDEKVPYFTDLSTYLLNVKNYLEKTLDSNYKSQRNLRFLYGKQFDTFNKHISGSLDIPSFLRYILNNLNDEIIINEGEKIYPESTTNYVHRFKDYSDDWFKTYDNYITSVLKENGISFEELYEKMKIKSNDGKTYKGIYLYKSDKNSMEEDILKIFIEKTKNIPIAQNILISNKETSFEEIQAFFHRAFLCGFNALFAIEINDSLSDNQLKIINNFITQLLKYQLNKYNNKNNTKVDITETSKYIEPLIIFVYNVNKLNESFLNEINKFNPGEYQKINEDISSIDRISSISSKKNSSKKLELKLNQILKSNTHIYSSEICGLGKTEKIKYEIEKTNKEYIYFPLGGKLSRNIIFKNVEEILKKVKDIKKTAIHLDLYETENISILNEFLFSFCFTKFYVNNENVLYIPIKIEIYIEIPNCFNNFLENYPILNYFGINKIDFNNKEKLRLDEEKTKFFNWMIPKEDEKGQPIKTTPEEFIIDNMLNLHKEDFKGTREAKFSYHQINIFIKLFMNQYKIDNKKLKFLEDGEDVTDKCIKNFAKCTKYFILGVYSKFLTGTLEEENYTSLNKDTNKNSGKIISDDTSNYESNIKIDLDNEKNSINSNSNQSEINDNNNNNANNNKSFELKEEPKKEFNNEIKKDYETLRKNYIMKLSQLYNKDLENEEYKTPLIFNYKNKDYYRTIFLSDTELEKYKSDIDFLEKIKNILELENPVLETKDSNLKSLKQIIDRDNYVITKDNFRKMILIIYRILADIPVILMGETGCGKTGLIRMLYQLLNNGEEMDPKKNMVNIDSSISDEKLIEKMDEINKEAKRFKKEKNKDFWVLFDEINTCNSLGILNEIFINRSYKGNKIEENIRLIGTCNPYRLKSDKEESCGLSHPYKNKNLAYDVNILPQSLMYFVFNFGFLSKDDEDRYIISILSKHFVDFDKDLINIVKEIISESHLYLRNLYGPSIVSLREITRFLKLYDNLIKYYRYKDELKQEIKKKEREGDNIEKKINKNIKKIVKKDNKNENIKLYQIKSLILATYLSYYIRLIDTDRRTNFEAKIKLRLIKLANYYAEKEEKEIEQNNNNIEGEESKYNEKKNYDQNSFNNPLAIKWNPLLKEYLDNKSESRKNFSFFLKIECNYIIDSINLDKGIAKNRILKENIFLQFIAITSNIPLIIIGKPGSSKSLSYQQLKNSMRGKYSENLFFRKYPKISPTYFQGSESTLADDVENLFERGKEILDKCNQGEKPISLIIFDEIGLSELAKDNPVKVLHKNLEYNGVEEGLSFVGFSNWKLDSSKLNRMLYLSVPDLDKQIDDLNETAKCIAESLRENNIELKLLEVLCKSYKSYKEMVRKIKEFVVYKELEIQEMKVDLDSLTQDDIKMKFNKDKKDITFEEYKIVRKDITKKSFLWKIESFSDLTKKDEYKTLYTNNRSVNEEFHGNRDFYNYIKGVCNIKTLSKNFENIDPDVNKQIEKVIERNFGGVDINLDIDLDMDKCYDDEKKNIKKLKDILNKCLNEKNRLRLPSVFLFKYIYNEELKELYQTGINNEVELNDSDNLDFEKYQINEENLNKYDLIQCINGNINDNDARFLLLEIEEGLKYLLCQNIISQNKDKVIKYMEGSPFINDIQDKNGEYKLKKISEIQNYCNKEMVLILSNLNQIYPFLYDFFNRNFSIKDDKKYCRICQGNVTEQSTYIHDKFRLIIMIDKSSIHKQESPFLNRFEKAIVKFEELLNNQQKTASKEIYNELGIKEHIQKKINYNIGNLLINCDKESIDRLYFYFSNPKLKPKQAIYEKIARTLPQDIIINLEETHPHKTIKSIYKEKKIFNFRDYINYLKELTNDKKNIFKFSIIYTFTSIISSDIEGINLNDSSLIISEIKRENYLIDLIKEKIFKKKKVGNNFIIMHFYQNELDKINFIISTIKNNNAEEDINFIFIVHIKRIMDKKKKEKIYSIPDIDETVDQIFIDNLEGLNISLDTIAKEGIKNILENSELKLFDKYFEFFKALKAYYDNYLNNLIYVESNFKKVKRYFEENKEFIDIILSKVFNLIHKESKYNNLDFFNEIKKEIFDNSLITSNTVDIVSSIINDVIIERRLRGKIMQVIDALESNNFLTTLLALDKNSSNKSFSSKENLCQMMQKYLSLTKITDIQNKAIFNNNYLIPGFLSFYNTISNFISKNITQGFSKNEKSFRDFLKGNTIKLKVKFHLEEVRLLDIASKEIIIDESDKYKFINEVINKCPSDLLLNDYINFFLNKNCENIYTIPLEEEFIDIGSNISINENDNEKGEEVDDFYMEIIKLIINLRYKDDSKIIFENKENELKKFLIKIIWLESNKNYISTIIQLFHEVRNRIYMNKKSNILLKQVIDLIKSNKINYITDENRNPEHTTEVNECYYIIIGALYLAITDLEKIVLYDPKNNRYYVEVGENQIRVEIEQYLECLQYIVKVSQPFNDMLYLFSNELYIIVNLNSIINLLKLQKKKYIDAKIVEKIIDNLRTNIDIIRESKFVKTKELYQNIGNLINLVSQNFPNKDENYYSLLRSILLQEIMKVKDKNYRFDLFKTYIINEKEILKFSNEIFDLLLKGFVIPLKDKILASIEKFENRVEEILLIMENKIKEKKNEYLSQILLYYFEKIFHIYLENYFKSKIEKKNEKNLLELEPLKVFEKCLDLLSKFDLNGSKIKNVSKLLYIGYIRVFLFKFEEYARDRSDKLNDPKKIINSINSFKNKISYIIELFIYKIVYNKNNKDISIFSPKNNSYNLESLNNFKDFFNFDDDYSYINLLEEKVNILKNQKEEYPFREFFYYSDYIDENYLSSIINNENKDYPVLAEYLELKNNGNLLNDFFIYNKILCDINDEFSKKITREYTIKETLDKQTIYNENKELFTKFFDIYNKLSDNYGNDSNDYLNEDDNENDNKQVKLNPKLPLLNFLIVDENEFSEKYKYFYKQFIDKHNEIVGKLVDAKPIINEEQNQSQINIQNITKEDEIFITKDNFSMKNILFNYSYRKVIINNKYSEFNKYEINLEYIEEMMTDKLLKNKKIISDEIFIFKYKNEDLEFKNKDICTKFKQKINEEELNINDKIIIYEYFEKNKGNVDLHLRLLDDFAYLIYYSCANIDKIIDPSQTNINNLLEGLEKISKNFKEIFKDRNNFTVNKLLNIYEYYQILCFNKVKENLIKYQEKKINKELENSINNYIKNDLKKNKNAVETALRKFILCFLAKEDNKENKIKPNQSNIKNYLEIEDLWDREFYKKNEFYQELKKLKNLGIKINNVIPFYEKCFNKNYKNYFDEVNIELKNREEERIRKEKEKEKEDINNFNPNDYGIDDNQNEIEENNNIDNNYNGSNENIDDDNGDDYLDQDNGEEEDYNLGRY